MSAIVQQMIETSGIANLTLQNGIMILLACFFLYLGIKKKYEPYLMIPIAFGMLLVNLPLANLMAGASNVNQAAYCIIYIWVRN